MAPMRDRKAMQPDQAGQLEKIRGAVFEPTSVVLLAQGLKTQTRRLAEPLRARWRRGERRPSQTRSFTAHIDSDGVIRVAPIGAIEDGYFDLVCPWIRYGTTGSVVDAKERLRWAVTPTREAYIRVLERWRTSEQDGVGGILYAAGGAFHPIEATKKAKNLWCDAHQNGQWQDRWRPPMYMPRWASRMRLRVVSARLERLQDITREDAIAEGVTFTDYGRQEHSLSTDLGATWGITTTQRAGWFYGPTTRSEQCLSTPYWAYANAWNRIHAGENWNLKPGPSPWDENPWVWAFTFQRA